MAEAPARGEAYWHWGTHCTSCQRRLEEGETVYPVSGTMTGLICPACLQERVPGAELLGGFRLNIDAHPPWPEGREGPTFAISPTARQHKVDMEDPTHTSCGLTITTQWKRTYEPHHAFLYVDYCPKCPTDVASVRRRGRG